MVLPHKFFTEYKILHNDDVAMVQRHVSNCDRPLSGWFQGWKLKLIWATFKGQCWLQTLAQLRRTVRFGRNYYCICSIFVTSDDHIDGSKWGRVVVDELSCRSLGRERDETSFLSLLGSREAEAGSLAQPEPRFFRRQQDLESCRRLRPAQRCSSGHALSRLASQRPLIRASVPLARKSSLLLRDRSGTIWHGSASIRNNFRKIFDQDLSGSKEVISRFS